MFKFTLFNFFIRIAISLSIILSYFGERIWLDELLSFNAKNPFVWLVFIYIFQEIFLSFFPSKNKFPACGKMFSKFYNPSFDKDGEKRLAPFTKQVNRQALLLIVIWLFVNSIFGTLKLTSVITAYELLLIAFLYYLGDFICILFWCPFQYLVKSRCCIHCRIFMWGPFMFTTLFVFIPGFFTWGLLIPSLVMLAFWEYYHLKYPERFYDGTNKTLHCTNCKEHMCRIKKPVKDYIR